MSGLVAARELPDQAAVTAAFARLDRLPLTRLHLLILIVCAGGLGVDYAELAIGSALSAVFSAPPDPLAPFLLGWLLSSVYVGAFFGAPAMGWVADRYGRKVVLSSMLLLLALTSAAAAAVHDVGVLIALRGLSGIALGAFPPLVIAYLTDLLPPRTRGTLVLLVSTVSALGPIGMVFLIRWLTPVAPLGIEAWRWAFVVGAAGSGLFGLLFLMLPESPRWLFTRGRYRQAEVIARLFETSPLVASLNRPNDRPAPVPVAGVHRGVPSKSTSGRIALVSVLFFLSPWFTIAFPLISGAILIGKGFQLSDTLFLVALATFGPLFGQLIAATVVDRIDRRVALAICASAMGVGGVLFIVSQSIGWLMVIGVAYYFFAAVYVPVLSLYASELFPTAIRGRASAGTWALNRLGSAIAPLVLLPLLHQGGPGWPMAVIAGAVVLSIVALLAFGPTGTAGRAIE